MIRYIFNYIYITYKNVPFENQQMDFCAIQHHETKHLPWIVKLEMQLSIMLFHRKLVLHRFRHPLFLQEKLEVFDQMQHQHLYLKKFN